MSWLAGIFDRIFAVAGALVCAQAPTFIQQYSLQLSGRVAELKLQIDAIANAATLGNKTVAQYIQRFVDSGDPDFMRQGNLMYLMAARYETLSDALQGINASSIWAKPFVFITHFNWEIAHMAFEEFQPAIPFTLEGIIYALIGIGLGYGLFAMLTFSVRGCYRSLANFVGKYARAARS